MNSTHTVHRTVFAHLHTVGDGKLPELVQETLSELNTLNGRATASLLGLCQNGLIVKRDKEEKVTAAEIILPARQDKINRLTELAAAPMRIDAETGRKVYEGNSYRIAGLRPETGMFTVRVFERYSIMKGVNPDHPLAPKGGDTVVKLKVLTDRLSANFLQAVFTSFLRLPFEEVPDIVVKPSLKQTAEQMLSHILLLAGEEQEAGAPDSAERDPLVRRNEWLRAVHEVKNRLEPFEYGRRGEIERLSENDPRYNQRVNISDDWVRFASSPFPGRLPLKIPPEFIGLFRRKTEGAAKIPERLYLALDCFKGAGENTSLGKLAQEEKLFWWRNHMEEFTPLSGFEKWTLRKTDRLLVVPLEYDREGRFEEAIGAGRKICLVTIKESRNLRKGRKGHSRKGRLTTYPRLWRADFATSAEVTVPEWKGKIIGIHFSDDDFTIHWALTDRSGQILEEGKFFGGPIVETGLFEKERQEFLQRLGRWVGDWSFKNQIKNLTHSLARRIVELAAEKDAWIALEEIGWVDKRGGDSAANRKSSMWNYSRLKTLIEWLGADIATRGGKAAPMIRSVSDYLVRFTCSSCGACRKAKQDKENADTYRSGGVLTCRTCGFEGEVSPEASARLVAKLGLETARKRFDS